MISDQMSRIKAIMRSLKLSSASGAEEEKDDCLILGWT